MTRYGQSAARWPLFGAIESSIACRTTIGIASDRTEYTSAQLSPSRTSCFCSRQSRARPFAVGHRFRSAGSTERERLLTSASYLRRLTRLTTGSGRLRKRECAARALHRPAADGERQEADDQDQEEKSALHGVETKTDPGR